MKCKLIVEKEIYEPTAPTELKRQCVRRSDQLFAPAGTIIDDPNCFWIVRMGQAEAADPECAKAAGQTPEQFAAAVHAAKRLAAGIAPEDFAKFDGGEITGYDADGNYVKGPNWVEATSENEEDE